MFDTHLHTTFSCDSSMSSLEAIEAAAGSGLGIIITEHLDLDYPENPEEFVFDIDEYFSSLDRYRSETVLLGVELGLRTDCNEENRKAVHGKPFDEIIGSIHVVGSMDIYRPSFTKGRPKQEAYRSYFSAMLECIKTFDDFDTLGHVDYICRYARYDDTNIYVAEFYDEWTAVCKALLEKEKALELNTRRLGDKNAVSALKGLYKRYKELGGKYITIGSDAHRTSDIGAHFSVAKDFSRELGLQAVYFKKRKMYQEGF